MDTKIEIPRVQGDYCKKTQHMTWECPRTNQECWVQGELFLNKKTNRVEHDVLTEDLDTEYIVESQEL